MVWQHVGRQTYYSINDCRNIGGIFGLVLSTEGHFITPALLLGCGLYQGGTLERLLYTVVCAILISVKFTNTDSFIKTLLYTWELEAQTSCRLSGSLMIGSIKTVNPFQSHDAM
jgi:hypothetical protein